MAQLNVQITFRKRWFFWPTILTMIALGKLGLLRDAAAKWLADHAMRFEVH